MTLRMNLRRDIVLVRVMGSPIESDVSRTMMIVSD